jgi:diaminopimelate epimerase
MIRFEKYQGTGNDFVMLDNRDGSFDELSISAVKRLCNRRFGIGADGLIWIKNHPEFDFEMRYFNADGSRSFCGNGARCAVMFAHSLGLAEAITTFIAIDGPHEAVVKDTIIHLKMNDVSKVEKENEAYVIHTGSPHYIKFVENLEQVDIVNFGKSIRYADKYFEEGINVNAASANKDGISLLTYERGVEDETLSCGTGATAAVLAWVHLNAKQGVFRVPVQVKGGELSVSGSFEDNSFHSIYLSGPAEKVFDGTISL